MYIYWYTTHPCTITFCQYPWLLFLYIRVDDTESIEWSKEGQAFSLSYDLAPPPLPPPFARPVIHRKTKKERQLAHERGRGRSQIIREREHLVLYKSFNSLWDDAFTQMYVQLHCTVYMIHISKVGMCMHTKNISICTVQCIRLCMKYHILKGIYTVL